MGLAQSREPQLRRNSFSQANRNSGKSSKRDELQTKFEAIDNVKTEIDLFGGNRQSERYSQIQQILTTISKDFQETKTTSSKQKTRNKCDEALGEIQNCLKRLENRVEFNEQTLDSAAVESHSFIQSFTPRQQGDDNELAKTLNRLHQELLKLEHDIRLNLERNDQNNLKLFEKKIQLLYKDLEMIAVDYQTPLGEQKLDIANKLDKCSNQLKKAHEDTHKTKAIREPPQITDASTKPIETLSCIEESALKLERDIKLCIELDDHNQLKLLKKKIQLLYTDLEMIVVDNHTPLSEKKAAIGKKLIKYNNQIRKSKRTSLQTMENIDKKLEQLGGEALMFNGTRSDGKYKSLQQELESYWSMVYPLECISSEERNKKEHLVAKIKNTLEELSNRAEESQRQFESLGKLNEQANRIKQLQENAVGFRGRSSDQTYVSVDQAVTRKCGWF
ncbi:hypothetical protein RI129_009279 [Pyrocoelia pectoralis]|uniref:Uncharacterized protein n=1 Tax=Pyrocoelia pectoralis TaxID=417401 RepID=A0AAN7ZFP7_9COLE